ncbi:MAG: hypothetical protein ACXADB_07850 [Candidatus Hermodarchaeia archaeon]|jgi:hypothetical protein
MENVEIRPNIHATRFEETVGSANWRIVEKAVKPVWDSIENLFITMKADVEFRYMLDSALEQMSDQDAVTVGEFMHRATEEIFKL